MVFKDRLREKRKEKKLTQQALAKEAGVGYRTIQGYELGQSRPGSIEIVQRLAEALDTSVEYLLGGSSGVYVIEAQEKGGAKAAEDIEELVGEISGLFAGGELSEDAMDGAMRALNDAYWIAKEKNKKYASRKSTRESAE